MRGALALAVEAGWGNSVNGRGSGPTANERGHPAFSVHTALNSQCASPREGRSRRDVLLAVLKKSPC